MGTELVWDDAQRSIVRWYITAPISWSATLVVMRETRQHMIAVAPQRVDIIIHLDHQQTASPFVLSEMVAFVRNLPPNAGGLVIVPRSVMLIMVRAVISVIRAVAPEVGRRFFIAESVAAAHKLIAQQRSEDAGPPAG